MIFCCFLADFYCFLLVFSFVLLFFGGFYGGSSVVM